MIKLLIDRWLVFWLVLVWLWIWFTRNYHALVNVGIIKLGTAAKLGNYTTNWTVHINCLLFGKFRMHSCKFVGKHRTVLVVARVSVLGLKPILIAITNGPQQLFFCLFLQVDQYVCMQFIRSLPYIIFVQPLLKN